MLQSVKLYYESISKGPFRVFLHYDPFGNFNLSKKERKQQQQKISKRNLHPAGDKPPLETTRTDRYIYRAAVWSCSKFDVSTCFIKTAAFYYQDPVFYFYWSSFWNKRWGLPFCFACNLTDFCPPKDITTVQDLKKSYPPVYCDSCQHKRLKHGSKILNISKKLLQLHWIYLFQTL